MGFWQNIRQSSDALLQLRRLSANASLSIENSPLKSYLRDLINQASNDPQEQIPVTLGGMDFRQIILVGMAQLTERQILELAAGIHGRLGEFLDQWSGQLSDSDAENTLSSADSQAAANRSLPDGSLMTPTKAAQSSTTQSTARQLASGAGKRSSTRGRS